MDKRGVRHDRNAEWRADYSTALTADFNGDKQTDLLLRGHKVNDSTAPRSTFQLVAKGLPSDLLVTVQNGLGGTTTVADHCNPETRDCLFLFTMRIFLFSVSNTIARARFIGSSFLKI